MSRYKEIYKELTSHRNMHGKPMNTSGLLAAAGIDVKSNDEREPSIEAVIVLLAERIKKLETELSQPTRNYLRIANGFDPIEDNK